MKLQNILLTICMLSSGMVNATESIQRPLYPNSNIQNIEDMIESAEQYGNELAIYGLADLARRGYEKALDSLIKVADQGNEEAIYALKSLADQEYPLSQNAKLWLAKQAS